MVCLGGEEVRITHGSLDARYNIADGAGSQARLGSKPGSKRLLVAQRPRSQEEGRLSMLLHPLEAYSVQRGTSSS